MARVAVILLVLLTGGVTLALAGLGSGNPFGGSEQAPRTPSHARGVVSSGAETTRGTDRPREPTGQTRDHDATETTAPASAPPPLVTSTADPTTAGPESTTPGPRPGGTDQVREVVEQYYYAVDYEEWGYTYHNLDSESQLLFSEEEWIEKNQWYADHEDLKLDSMSIDVGMQGSTRAKVTVNRTFEDGTFISRDTYFVWEDVWWRHHLTEEEKKIFMPGLSYEEFVAAQR